MYYESLELCVYFSKVSVIYNVQLQKKSIPFLIEQNHLIFSVPITLLNSVTVNFSYKYKLFFSQLVLKQLNWERTSGRGRGVMKVGTVLFFFF